MTEIEIVELVFGVLLMACLCAIAALHGTIDFLVSENKILWHSINRVGDDLDRLKKRVAVLEGDNRG